MKSRLFVLESGIRQRDSDQKEPEEIAYQLLHYDRDANTIVHLLEWPSLDNARRFFESPELSRSWGTAGVKPARFIYLQEIERGPL